jgi:hypothetical protein
MNPYKLLTAFLLVAFLAILCNHCHAQVVVNGKNLNNDRDLEYIQLMYYIDKASIKPVFFVDYGFIEPEYTDILEPEHPEHQTITINGEPVTDRVTVVWVLNKMNKAGWEYMGDVVFIELKIMNDWHVYTLRRK